MWWRRVDDGRRGGSEDEPESGAEQGDLPSGNEVTNLGIPGGPHEQQRDHGGDEPHDNREPVGDSFGPSAPEP